MNLEKSKEDYPEIFAICKFFTVVGILIIIAAVIGFFYGLSQLGSRYSFAEGLAILTWSIVCGLLVPVSLFGFSWLLKLLIKIEMNTRSNEDEYAIKQERGK